VFWPSRPLRPRRLPCRTGQVPCRAARGLRPGRPAGPVLA